MATLLILGAGTAGTMLANKLRRELSDDWSITVVDQDNRHDYQPGYLFISFGTYAPGRVTKERWAQLHEGIETVEGRITGVDPDARTVSLADGRTLGYDWLVIATGTRIHPEMVAGLTDERIWHKKAFDFYTLGGSIALHDALEKFQGGRLLVHIAEMPIKCPVAPLEFAFLADDYFRRRRMRHKVDITYVTPLDGAFTKPVSSRALGKLMVDKSIRLATDFDVEAVDPATSELTSFDGRRLPFDLLVTIPPHKGADFLVGGKLADAMGFVEVDKTTLRSVHYDNVFAVGDATNAPTSKAGAVAHFAAEQLAENLLQAFAGEPMTHEFDGHANCFIESGARKALLIDFNYDTEPLSGVFPAPVVGPLRLLRESRVNHLGKLGFEQIYWRMILPGRPIPGIPVTMSMAGKVPAAQTKDK